MDALDLQVFDIIALGDIPVRVAVVGAATVALDFIGQKQSSPFFVEINDKRLRDIKVTEEVLLMNGFHDCSDHTLKGSSTFKYHNDRQTITVKIDDYAKEDYLDDCRCVNHETRYVRSLRELQHVLSSCHVKERNGERKILVYYK